MGIRLDDVSVPEDLTLSILGVYGDDRSWLVGLGLLCLFS